MSTDGTIPSGETAYSTTLFVPGDAVHRRHLLARLKDLAEHELGIIVGSAERTRETEPRVMNRGPCRDPDCPGRYRRLRTSRSSDGSVYQKLECSHCCKRAVAKYDGATIPRRRNHNDSP